MHKTHKMRCSALCNALKLQKMQKKHKKVLTSGEKRSIIKTRKDGERRAHRERERKDKDDIRQWRPSKSAAREFAKEMAEINEFCAANNIEQSRSGDSYYFSINGKSYRVSNHSVEASNRGAFNEFGEQVRQKYHGDGRDENTIYIHAGKTRIIEIYENLKAGKELDGRGNIKY